MKEVFVFGAGASAASADTPLGPGLVWDYHRDCSLLKPIINGKPDTSGDDIAFANYTKFLELAIAIYPELRPELEKWSNRGMYFFSPALRNKKYYIDDLLRIVLECEDDEGTALIRTLIFEHITGVSLHSANELYKNFTVKILKSRKPGSVSIISFNFDTLLHEDFENDVYFDYLLKFDEIDVHRAGMYKRRNPIPFIKPHGSLDWWIKNNGLYLHFYQPRKGQIDLEGLEPFVVMPHQKSDERLDLLWARAADELSQATEVTIVGYSFPDYDPGVINLFRNSLPSDAIIEVVDFCGHPNDPRQKERGLREKYGRLFPHLREDIQIRLDGFSEYLSEFNGG